MHDIGKERNAIVYSFEQKSLTRKLICAEDLQVFSRSNSTEDHCIVRDDLPNGRPTTFNIVQSKISSNELFVHRINKIFKYFVKFKAFTCLRRCRGKVHSPLNF